MSTVRTHTATCLALALIGLAACGGDSTPPPTANSLQAVGSTSFTGFTDAQLTSPLQVRVVGSDGNPFTGQPVTWAVTAGGGSLSTTSTTTDASGNASVTWTLGPLAGEHTATATAAGVGTVTFTATVTFQTLEPSVDIPIEGVIDVDRVIIPAGVTVTVTGPTTITSTGEISIAGTLEGDCQELQITGGASGTVDGLLSNACDNVVAPPNPPGLDFTIDGQLDISGDVRSSGDIFISNSPALTLAAVHLARQQGIAAVAPMLASARIDPCNILGGNIGGPADPPVKGAPGEDGAKGRSIAMACSGDFIAGGDGAADTGEGGEPGDQDEDAGNEGGAPASSSGGNGGNGGDWDLITNQGVRFDGYTIRLERGVDGRDAAATASNEGQSAVADGGDGGEGGGLQITAGGGIVITSAGLRIIVGGGGHGGDATATAMKGRDGNGEAAQNGGSATATGGTGGGTSPGRLNASGAVTGTINVQLLRHPIYSDGGVGGTATANAGDGGDGGADHPDGARGGTMTAHGGTGGDIQTQAFSGAFVGMGGDGGDVVVGGGNGGMGYDYCADPAREGKGGDGGMGGSVGDGTIPGVGGDGGPGTLEDGDEGEVTVTSGTGNGGDGNDGEQGGGDEGMKGSDDGFATQFENGKAVQRADDTDTFEDGKAGDACNTKPILNNTEGSTPRNTAVTVSIPYMDAEADAPDLSSITVNGLDAAEGSASGFGYTPDPSDATLGTITFTFLPATDFVGTATFLVGVTDQRGELAQSQANVSVTVTNAAPVFNAGDGAIQVSVLRGESVSIAVPFADPEGDVMDFALVGGGGPNNGTLTPSTFPANTTGVSTQYTHDGSAGNSDMFSVEADDRFGGTAVGQVNISIVDNAAPQCMDPGKVVELLAGESLAFQLSATDAEGETITWEMVDAPELGEITGFPQTGGTIGLTYTSSGTPGLDRVTYTVTDTHGNSTQCEVLIKVLADQKLILTTGSLNAAEGIIRYLLDMATFGATVPAPPEAFGMTRRADGLFVAVTHTGSIVLFDPDTGLPVGSFGTNGVVTDAAGLYGVATLPDHKVLVTNKATGELLVLSPTGAILERNSVGPYLGQLRASPDGSKIFMFQRNDPDDILDDELVILDGPTRAAAGRVGRFFLLDMKISPDGKFLIFTSLVGDSEGNPVLAYDVYDIEGMELITQTQVPVPEAGTGAGGVAFSPDGEVFYLTDQANSRALAFSTADRTRQPQHDITGIPVIDFREILTTADGLRRIFLGPHSFVIQDVVTGEFGPQVAIPDLFFALLTLPL